MRDISTFDLISTITGIISGLVWLGLGITVLVIDSENLYLGTNVIVWIYVLLWVIHIAYAFGVNVLRLYTDPSPKVQKVLLAVSCSVLLAFLIWGGVIMAHVSSTGDYLWTYFYVTYWIVVTLTCLFTLLGCCMGCLYCATTENLFLGERDTFAHVLSQPTLTRQQQGMV